MSHYINQPHLEYLLDVNGCPLKNRDGRHLYLLLVDLIYQSDLLKNNVTTKKGFITDLASVMQIPVIYDRISDMSQGPFVTHDDNYNRAVLPRDISDKILLEGMMATYIPSTEPRLIAAIIDAEAKSEREAIYYAVRVGGASHYGTV